MARRMRRGFTLLEIMIVVGILVLLASLVLPNIIGATKKANIKVAQMVVANNGPIANALKQYFADIQAYPTTEQGLAALVEKPADEAVAAKWGPDRYLDTAKTSLTDPWGHPFRYACPGDNNKDSYDLSSDGPDGQQNTDDDIVNWTTEAKTGT